MWISGIHGLYRALREPPSAMGSIGKQGQISAAHSCAHTPFTAAKPLKII